MTKENSSVTIICSCYNHADYVVESLNSIINQTYQPIQLIIVDDFSNDKSVNVIEKWLKIHSDKDILFIKNIKNLGLNKSFNHAYKFAKGDFIMDFSADDILFPQAIEHLIFAFNNSIFKNCGIVFGNVKFYTIDNHFERDYLPQNERPPTGYIAEAFQNNSFEMCSVSALYKREVYDQLKGYDENLMYEDLDFWLRATRLFEVDYTKEYIVKRQTTPTSLQSQFFRPLKWRTFLMNLSTYHIMKKTFIENNFDKTLNNALLKRITYYRKRLKYNYFLKLKYFILEQKIKKTISQ